MQFNYNTERVAAVFGATYSLEDTFQRTDSNALADYITRLVTQDLNATLGTPFDHIWNPNEFAFLLNALGIPATPEEVVDTGDLYYDVVSGAFGAPIIFGPSFAGTVWNEAIINEGEFENYGVYADVEYALTQQLSLTAGLRYSEDNKDFSWLIPVTSFASLRPGVSNQIFTGATGEFESAATTPLEASDSWSKTTGRLVASYQLSDELITYASYSTGYKAGGFDSLGIESSQQPLAPEESDQIELGLKGDLFSGRLRLQLALFELNVDGRQRSVETRPPGQGNAIPTVINVDTGVQGFEVNASWLIAENLLLTGLTTWRTEDTTSGEFYDANGELTRFDESNDAANDYTMTLDWRPQFATGELLVRGEYIFRENTRSPEDPNYNPAFESVEGYTDDTTLVNARVAWTNSEASWEIALWGRNLLDEKSLNGISQITAASFGTPYARIADPRTYGIEALFNV